MKKVIFIDQNESLVNKVSEAIKYLPFKGISVKHGDIFSEKGVIVSASNPDFTMGGGLDALIKKHYPMECSQVIKGQNQRIDNVIFTITVDKDIKASRELVDSAIKFALDNLKDRETLLISGLGTGIGGLHEDDFVWLFIKNICEFKGFGWGIKYTQENGDSFNYSRETYKHTNYRVGKWAQEPKAVKDGDECGVGLHLGRSFKGAGNYATPDRIFFCLYDKKDFCGEGVDKIRISKTLPLYVMPKWLAYGEKGYKIIENIEAFKPSDYNPYTATKLPKLDILRAAWDQVWDQVGDQVVDQVWAVSYLAVKTILDLDCHHPFDDFIKLGVMIVFVTGKAKVFGKDGKYLGEYDEKDFIK